MKRFAIFSALFPPLALAVYIFNDPLFLPSIEIGFFLWVLGCSYPIALVPAWVTAAVDSVLAASPSPLRLVGSAAIASIMAILVARAFAQQGETLMFASMGAIPAVVCSLLSTLMTKPSKGGLAIGRDPRPFSFRNDE